MFQKDMYKRYFQWFSNVSKFMYKGTFSMISSNVYLEKYVQRFFGIYIFYVHSKELFNDFIFV